MTVLVIEPDLADPLGPLGDWLIASGVELEVIRPPAGDAVPGDLDDYHGLVVLGGSMGAADDEAYPYLAAVRRLLAEAVAREVPTLGVCLGAQLLAAATGGRVDVNPRGPEYGRQLIAKRANAVTDPLFGPLPITPDVIQWHVDAVTVLPPGAVQLASSPVTDNQAFRLGRLAWGVQFHIETTPRLRRIWAEEDTAALADYDVEAILARADAAEPDLIEVWAPFAQRFAAIVLDPSSVPTARPIQVSTAEPVTDPAAIRAALNDLAGELNASRSPLPWPSTEPPS